MRFGAATFFHDVLVRFGYDLFEHEHPWDGEWLDDDFERAALDLRATGAKLLRALERVSDDAEEGPFTVDLCVAYVQRILDDLAVVIPSCHGVEGRTLPRGDLVALGFPPPVDLSFPTHTPELFAMLDASSRPVLPKALSRAKAQSQLVTREAIASLDRAMGALCPWLDDVVDAMAKTIAAVAEDGDDLLERWAEPDWTVVGRATPNLRRRLPCV